MRLYFIDLNRPAPQLPASTKTALFRQVATWRIQNGRFEQRAPVPPPTHLPQHLQRQKIPVGPGFPAAAQRLVGSDEIDEASSPAGRSATLRNPVIPAHTDTISLFLQLLRESGSLSERIKKAARDASTRQLLSILWDGS
jgi:hypothetical protein